MYRNFDASATVIAKHLAMRAAITWRPERERERELGQDAESNEETNKWSASTKRKIFASFTRSNRISANVSLACRNIHRFLYEAVTQSWKRRIILDSYFFTAENLFVKVNREKINFPSPAIQNRFPTREAIFISLLRIYFFCFRIKQKKKELNWIDDKSEKKLVSSRGRTSIPLRIPAKPKRQSERRTTISRARAPLPRDTCDRLKSDLSMFAAIENPPTDNGCLCAYRAQRFSHRGREEEAERHSFPLPRPFPLRVIVAYTYEERRRKSRRSARFQYFGHTAGALGKPNHRGEGNQTTAGREGHEGVATRSRGFFPPSWRIRSTGKVRSFFREGSRLSRRIPPGKLGEMPAAKSR